MPSNFWKDPGIQYFLHPSAIKFLSHLTAKGKGRTQTFWFFLVAGISWFLAKLIHSTVYAPLTEPSWKCQEEGTWNSRTRDGECQGRPHPKDAWGREETVGQEVGGRSQPPPALVPVPRLPTALRSTTTTRSCTSTPPRQEPRKMPTAQPPQPRASAAPVPWLQVSACARRESSQRASKLSSSPPPHMLHSQVTRLIPPRRPRERSHSWSSFSAASRVP